MPTTSIGWQVSGILASTDKAATSQNVSWPRRFTTPAEGHGYLGQHMSFAIGPGCELAHADKLVYPTGITVDDPATAVPIGAACKIRNRVACPQRASPTWAGR